MKKLFYAYAWLLLTAGVILTSIAGWHFWRLAQEKSLAASQTEQTNSTAEASLNESEVQGVETVAEPADARAVIVAEFLERYRSPLEPYDYYGKKLVEIADRYNLDFRLLPAIAMKESGLCKNIPESSYNCLGWGITDSNTLKFEGYEDSFESAAKGLRTRYVDSGKITTNQVAQIYNPVTPEQWADGVNQFMAEMRFNDRELGIELRNNTNVTEFALEATKETEPRPTPTENP